MIPTIPLAMIEDLQIIEILIPARPRQSVGAVGAFVVLANPIGAVVAAVGSCWLVPWWSWLRSRNFQRFRARALAMVFSRFGDGSGAGDTIVTGFNNATSAAERHDQWFGTCDCIPSRG